MFRACLCVISRFPAVCHVKVTHIAKQCTNSHAKVMKVHNTTDRVLASLQMILSNTTEDILSYRDRDCEIKSVKRDILSRDITCRSALAKI